MNRQNSVERAWKSLLLRVALLVVLAPSSAVTKGGVVVEAFQSISFGIARQSLGCSFKSQGDAVPFITENLHQTRCRSNLLARLSMTTDPKDESKNTATRQSKRKRFKESVKRLISFPKKKLKSMKLGGQGSQTIDESDQESSESVIVNGQGHERSMDAQTAEVNDSRQQTTENIAEDAANGATITTTRPIIVGRSATSETTDFTGKWELIVSKEFKTEYDEYLQLLGQPSLVRSVALSIIGMTSEETIQSQHGQELIIRGRNVRGNWERTLQASTKDNPLVVPIVTADDETVQSECWWEDSGSVHKSWLRGVNKYGGGSFESKRFLENDDNTLVCQSTFFPSDSSREEASVTWRFRRAD